MDLIKGFRRDWLQIERRRGFRGIKGIIKNNILPLEDAFEGPWKISESFALLVIKEYSGTHGF
jgi:hypothetical protein